MGGRQYAVARMGEDDIAVPGAGGPARELEKTSTPSHRDCQWPGAATDSDVVGQAARPGGGSCRRAPAVSSSMLRTRGLDAAADDCQVTQVVLNTST